MADIILASFDSCLTCWDRTADYRKYIRGLGDNLTALESKIHELGRVYSDVNRLIQTAEGEGWMRKDVAGGWLDDVKVETEGCNKILADGKAMLGRNCLCGLCFKNCRARYRQSKLAEAKKGVLEAIVVRGRTFGVKDDVAYEPADFILKRSLEALQRKSDELRDVLETVKQRVKWEEERYLVRTPDVGGWLVRVEGLLSKQVHDILQKGELEAADSQSRRNCISCRQISKDAQDKIPILEEELGKGRGFTTFTNKPNDPLMVEIPHDNVVGLDSNFEKVWKWVQDEKVRCIGLYGMGGVGKTTLLKKIHNELLKVEHNYDLVDWIVLSRPTNREKIQQAIWRSLRLPESDWDRTTEMVDRASRIFNALKEKRFLLFLDDIWEEINLIDLGITSHNHRHKLKIIFTTRSEEVCYRMKADVMEKVDCLPLNKALELFREKVGEATWSAHIEIPKLAEAVVKECHCLPLALITVGATMSTRKDLDGWRRALKVLSRGLSNFKGMELVLFVLQFSYEALPDEAHKKCFVYCSMFPEDHEINIDELIDLWIGEGFLEECKDIHEARDCAADIINSLIHACLLEDSTSNWNRAIRLHDVVRDMALWVGTEHGTRKNKMLVQADLGSFDPKEVKKWNDAEMISLWNVKAEETIHHYNFVATLSCSNLSTLILRRTNVAVFPSGFFSSMPSLKVLDLSENEYLYMLPEDIRALVHLRYLSVFRTSITELPVIIKSLINLVVLLVDGVCVVPRGVISSLSSLKVFRRFTGYPKHLSWEHVNEEEELNLIEEIEEQQSVNGIEEVHLEIHYAAPVQKLVKSCPQLQRCLWRLSIGSCKGLEALVIPRTTLRQVEHLSDLTIHACEIDEISVEDGEYDHCGERIDGSNLLYIIQPPPMESQDCFRSLKRISIWNCNRLRELTVLMYHAPGLTHLYIGGCGSMREVIAGDVDDSHVNRLLPCLSVLRLGLLQNLESICRRELPFPSLNSMTVGKCPKLKKLPLDNSSGSRVDSLKIEGEREWWEELEWDDRHTKTLFSHNFAEIKWGWALSPFPTI